MIMLIHRANSWAQLITSCALQIMWLSFFDDSIRDAKWLSFTKYICQRSSQIGGKPHLKWQQWFLPSLGLKGFETIDSEFGFRPFCSDFSSNFGLLPFYSVGVDNVRPWVRTRFCNFIDQIAEHLGWMSKTDIFDNCLSWLYGPGLRSSKMIMVLMIMIMTRNKIMIMTRK